MVATRTEPRWPSGGASASLRLGRQAGSALSLYGWITTSRASVICRTAYAGPSLVLPLSRTPP